MQNKYNLAQNNNILIEELFSAYKSKDLEKIYDITRMNVPKFKHELIDYLKTKSLNEIFQEIIFFNTSILNEEYKLLPIYFFDDNWIILEILSFKKENLMQSKGKVIDSSFLGLKEELEINVILNESENGILLYGACFSGES